MKKEKQSHRKYSKEEKQVYVKRFQESGLSLRTYSKMIGIAPSVVSYWNKNEKISSNLVSCSDLENGLRGVATSQMAPASVAPAADASIEGSGGLTSESNVFIEEQEKSPMSAKEQDLIEEKRLLEEELAEVKRQLKATKERAYNAELKSFVLDTLIEVADETYDMDLKKNFGFQR